MKAIVFIFLSFICATVSAQSPAADDHTYFGYRFEPFKLDLRGPERPRNTWWPPIASFLLPGFDQWYEAQEDSAVVYTGLGVVGLAVMEGAHLKSTDDSSAENQLTNGDDRVRQYLLGGKIYEVAGELSMYHSFRSAVRTRWQEGKYKFLTPQNEETPDQLMLAPFHFSYMKRPTTYIPVGLAILAVALDSSVGHHQLQFSDGFYSSSISYSAGVGEESLFRGYIHPQLMESFDSPFWANTSQSILFGAAHIASDNKVPVVQAVFGWYMGWLSQQNNWTIGEGIFIHAWWDTILLAYDLSDHSKNATVLLPLWSSTF